MDSPRRREVRRLPQGYPGDFETQVGQGPITLHSEERLPSTDRSYREVVGDEAMTA